MAAHALACALIVVCGCDNRSGSRPPGYSEVDSTQSTTSTTTPARPTTQELLSGSYKRISLFPLPLTISAPQSWSVNSMAERIYFLQGPAPGATADVQIQLAERNSETKDKLDRLFRAAKRDAEQHPGVTRVDVRQLGNVRVFDVQRVLDATDVVAPSIDSPSNTGLPAKLVDWSITYFVPRGSDFAAYELHFFSLSREQFESDKDFFRKLLDSVQPQDTGLGITPESK